MAESETTSPDHLPQEIQAKLFPTYEALFEELQKAARDAGFAVKKIRACDKRTDGYGRYDLACEYSQKYVSTAKKYKTKSHRCNCPWAAKAVNSIGAGCWKLTFRKEEHNHPRTKAVDSKAQRRFDRQRNLPAISLVDQFSQRLADASTGQEVLAPEEGQHSRGAARQSARQSARGEVQPSQKGRSNKSKDDHLQQRVDIIENTLRRVGEVLQDMSKQLAALHATPVESSPTPSSSHASPSPEVLSSPQPPRMTSTPEPLHRPHMGGVVGNSLPTGPPPPATYGRDNSNYWVSGSQPLSRQYDFMGSIPQLEAMGNDWSQAGQL